MGKESFLLTSVQELARGWKYRGEFSSRGAALERFAFISMLGWEVDIGETKRGYGDVSVYTRSPADLAKASVNLDQLRSRR